MSSQRRRPTTWPPNRPRLGARDRPTLAGPIIGGPVLRDVDLADRPRRVVDPAPTAPVIKRHVAHTARSPAAPDLRDVDRVDRLRHIAVTVIAVTVIMRHVARTTRSRPAPDLRDVDRVDRLRRIADPAITAPVIMAAVPKRHVARTAPVITDPVPRQAVVHTVQNRLVHDPLVRLGIVQWALQDVDLADHPQPIVVPVHSVPAPRQAVVPTVRSRPAPDLRVLRNVSRSDGRKLDHLTQEVLVPMDHRDSGLVRHVPVMVRRVVVPGRIVRPLSGKARRRPD